VVVRSDSRTDQIHEATQGPFIRFFVENHHRSYRPAKVNIGGDLVASALRRVGIPFPVMKNVNQLVSEFQTPTALHSTTVRTVMIWFSIAALVDRTTLLPCPQDGI
jgi:hypothetical protein